MYTLCFGGTTWTQPQLSTAPSPLSVPEITCMAKTKYHAGQACLSPDHRAKYATVPVSEQYEACLARIPLKEKAPVAPWLSTVQASASSPPISFQASNNHPCSFHHRVPAWNLGVGAGGSCSSEMGAHPICAAWGPTRKSRAIHNPLREKHATSSTKSARRSFSARREFA